jgi:hypothetical protein
MSDTFKGFSCLPQGVIGGCRGCKFLRKSLDWSFFMLRMSCLRSCVAALSSRLLTGVRTWYQSRRSLHFSSELLKDKHGSWS